ncbi:MAG: hypothetical protein GY906_15210, partial [bacterium]|nr:hypothetical protein [bacterium]
MTTTKTRFECLLLAVCFAVSSLPSVGFSGDEPPIRIVLPNEPGALDPHIDPTWVGGAILANVYDPLLTTDAKGNVVPVLATSWEKADDNAWQFTIREGVLFHDGETLNAADVAASIDRVCQHPQSQAKVRFKTVVRTVIVDSSTVRVELTGPDAVFLKKLESLSIVPADSPDEITKPVGTGAYRFAGITPGASLRLEAFSDYWGPKPSEQQAEFLFEDDHNQSIDRLVAGKVEMVSNLTPESLARVEADDDLWVDSAVGSYVHML